jgi:hypothetical protein
MATRKKQFNYMPWVIGLGAAGILGYLFKDQIKALVMPEETTTDDETKDEPAPVIQQVITNGGVISTPVGITKGLSGLGTPKERLNLNQTLKQGDKGQEIAKLQQILNRIAKITRKPMVTEDGDFGQGTLTRLTDLFSSGETNLFKAYAALFAIWNANKNKDLKNWFKKYYEPYLTDKERYQNARTFYFANNNLI